ncbi:RimJ/RimL family protein N-acetyltransferase [Dokdonia sp. Hel_I_63]|uniref:GNAT family N-acetyltransferase n=1 Tax=Dokdonia sp. Hel_I_63 TaxID=1249996 RepID=UPI00119A4FB0|nr:GNAT family N-acetyltransferase [Dokdonia sp. Hel_I_63]TVZ23771.1 RimJ/RimL family protein N-acetyltransferase [Dokdonia sp. Hel_I_63]
MNIIGEILDENLVLESERLKVYPGTFDKKIINDLLEIYSNDDNVRGYSKVYKNPREFVHVMADKILRHQNEINGFICYVIELKTESKIIGLRNIILDGVYNFQNKRLDNNNNISSEIIINSSYWRQGYAKEASVLIFNYLSRKSVKNVAVFLERSNYISLFMSMKFGFKEIDSSSLVKEYGFNEDYKIHFDNKESPRILIKKLNA